MLCTTSAAVIHHHQNQAFIETYCWMTRGWYVCFYWSDLLALIELMELSFSHYTASVILINQLINVSGCRSLPPLPSNFASPLISDNAIVWRITTWQLHTHTHTRVYTAVLYMHLVTIVGHGCAEPERNREKQAEELCVCSSVWIRSLLLYHHPPFELPHSRKTLIFTETIKSTGFKIDIIILPRSRSCSLGNLLCCLMELMSWHTYCICVVLPKHPHHSQSPPLTVQRMEMPALF